MVFFLLSPDVKILFLKKIFYQKDASRIKEEGKRKGEMYRLSSSNLIRKGLARVHLFVLSLRYRYALCFTRHADKTGPTFLWMTPQRNLFLGNTDLQAFP